MQVGKLNPLGKINFPGFQEILDFTATGSESSVSVSVNGDTDKEYKIVIYNPSATKSIQFQLNNDTGSNYGTQYIRNSSGSLSAARGTNAYMSVAATLELMVCTMLTPTGFIKTCYASRPRYASGTTMQDLIEEGNSWNNTANVTLIKFTEYAGGTMDAGTRIVVYARRSQS